MKVYLDRRDWWVGYYRGDTHHYVCPLPTVVIRWRRSLGDAPRWSDGDPWRGWTLVRDPDGGMWAVYSRLATTDRVVSIDMRPPEQVVGTVTEAEATIDGHDSSGRPGYRMVRQAMRLRPRARRWGPYPPHYTRGFEPLGDGYCAEGGRR